MLALTLLVGLLCVLLAVVVKLAWVAMPSGRLCPQCGGPTSNVVPSFLIRFLSRWIQWRWCSRCGWEGAGRNGPAVEPHEPPVDHESGFRWQRPDGTAVPVFYWRPEDEESPSAHPSGFRWADSDAPETPADHPSGFRFRSKEDTTGPRFEWADRPPSRSPRPKARRFRWKDN